MLAVLNIEAKKYGLRVIADLSNYKVINKYTDSVVYESPLSEEVACYFGRLEVAKRFGE